MRSADFDFFQENLYVGWRFFHRRAELMLGLLNLSGQNYQLNPLTEYSNCQEKGCLKPGSVSCFDEACGRV